jgi:FkbM family methyltransferase
MVPRLNHDRPDGGWLARDMKISLKKMYLKTLMRFFFDQEGQGQEPTRMGSAVLPWLPHPPVTWLNGYDYMPYYFNRRWLKKSFQRAHEPALEKFIIAAVPQKATVIDVGAQVGLISVLLSKKVGPQGRVIAFEPNPYNWGTLNRVLKENGLGNVETIPKAVGGTKGISQFKRTVQWGYRKIAEPAGTDPCQSEWVEVVRLDDFCRQQNIKQVDFIKIDIDGPDFEALIGAQGVLESEPKPLLSIEMSHYWKEFGYRFDDAFHYLRGFGYHMMIAQRRKGELLQVNSPSEVPENWGSEPKMAFNFFAYHPRFHCQALNSLLFN